MRKLTFLAIIGCVMVMMFALTLGAASANDTEYDTANDAKDGGINNADEQGGAFAPAGGPTNPDPDGNPETDDAKPGAPGREGINNANGTGGGGLNNNPLCPLNDGWIGHGGD